MTRAEQVVSAYNRGTMTYTDLLDEANIIATATDQDWDAEATTFIYSDASICVFEGVGQTITAYGCAD